MNILDHLDLLEVVDDKSTYVVCKCPNCQETRLKISKRPQCLGAYKCWSGCTTEQVKEAMSLSKSKNYYLSPYKKVVTKSVYSTNLKIEQAKQIDFDLDLSKLIKTPSSFEPISRTTRQFISSTKTITIYPYSECQRVYRLDSESGKEIYLQHKTPDGVWEAGTGNKDWPVYVRGLDLSLEGDTVLFVEGEKVAEFVKEKLGIAVVTVASHVYTKESLYRTLYLFFKRVKKNLKVVIIPDDDTPGYKKAELVGQMLNYLKIPNKTITTIDVAKILGLNILSFEPLAGLDLADFNIVSV